MTEGTDAGSPQRGPFIVTEVKIANPGPLGLCGFALTTFVLSCVNAGILKPGGQPIVIGLALFYGGLAQLLAGMWEFRTGNTFGATAFVSYGAFWLSFGAILVPGFGVKIADAATFNKSAGIFIVGWTIFTGIMLLASLRTNAATALVFILLFLAFLFLALGFFSANVTDTGPDSLTKIGGYLGIATAIAAWYTALAGLLSSVFGGKTILPVIPLSKA
ncbi:MAG: acetate uptake transporter [Ktedonobacterales bacterium]